MTEQWHVLAVIRQREAEMLNPETPILMTLLNPFRRRGMTAEDVAYAMGWFTGKVLKSGRSQADIPRARRVLKEMADTGALIELGRARTLHCGSRSKAMYATPEYEAKCEERIETPTTR